MIVCNKCNNSIPEEDLCQTGTENEDGIPAEFKWGENEQFAMFINIDLPTGTYTEHYHLACFLEVARDLITDHLEKHYGRYEEKS